jgi:predicted pyridoxine 5'-phosphate oxidase superfamily flavin-nucleotide-binding protein
MDGDQGGYMAHRFSELMFTLRVKSVQAAEGSRASYRRFERPDPAAPDPLAEAERDFIAARDSFYMATVSETGWPYVQHRGGPLGFLKVLDGHTLGFLDHRGNRQHLFVGNLMGDSRIALFLMDYSGRRRLKIIGHARIAEADGEPELIWHLQIPRYGARAERAIIIKIEGYDWNCPQHIVARITQVQIADSMDSVRERIVALKAENATLRERLWTAEGRADDDME